MRHMSGNSRQFSLLAMFVLTTAVCLTLAARHWFEAVPWLLPKLVAATIGAMYLFVFIALATRR